MEYIFLHNKFVFVEFEAMWQLKKRVSPSSVPWQLRGICGRQGDTGVGCVSAVSVFGQPPSGIGIIVPFETAEPCDSVSPQSK